jgi:hypothetical protein
MVVVVILLPNSMTGGFNLLDSNRQLNRTTDSRGEENIIIARYLWLYFEAHCEERTVSGRQIWKK